MHLYARLAWSCAFALALCGQALAAEAQPPVQVALVGCAHIHTPSFIALLKSRADVKIKCVWDHETARARKYAGETGAAVVDDVGKVWGDPDIQTVLILSETDRHEELVLAAAKARKHLFVEKPLGLGAKDAYAMMQAVEAAGVIFQMGYTQRGEGRFLFLKEQLAAGTLGRITRVRAVTAHAGALEGMFDKDFKWVTDFNQSGVGGMGDIGTHSLDLLLLLMGEVEQVTAAVTPGTARYGCDEAGEGLIRFKNGVVGTFAGSWVAASNPITLQVCGTEGSVVFMHDYVYFQSNKVEGATGKRPHAKLPKSLPNVLELFIDAVQGKPDVPLVKIREAAYCSAVMEALYQSVKENKWVAPPLPPDK